MSGGSLLIDDFSGGLNLRDSPNQLHPNESPDCQNFTLTQRGALIRRKGCANVVALPGTSGTKADIFYSEALDLWLCARESGGAYKLFSRPGDLSGSWTDRGTIASATTARTVFADWPGTTPYALILTDTADATNGGVYTLDSTPTLTKRLATDAKAIAVWQNKAWIAGGWLGSPGNLRSQLSFSAAGDPTSWTSNVQLREKDASPITALGLVSGALIVFKKRSTYRVNDSATGAYTLIDTAAGCVNPRAVVALRGRLYVWGADGLYEADGVGALKNIGDKLRPIYTDSALDTSLIEAGVSNDRVILSLPNYQIGTTQTLASFLEYDPEGGWLVAHELPAASQNDVSSMAVKDGVLYAAVHDGDDLFRLFTETPGADDGTGYEAAWFTPWLLPNSGMIARLHRARVQGLSDDADVEINLGVIRDWDLNTDTAFTIGSALFSSAPASVQQKAADVNSLGHGSAFQFYFRTDTDTGNVSIRALQLIDQSLAWPSPGYPSIQTPRGSHRTARRDPIPIPNQRRSPPPPPPDN